MPLPTNNLTIEDILNRCMVAPGPLATPCWFWAKALTHDGYARVRQRTVQRIASNVAWELVNGPVPRGFQLDHLCNPKDGTILNRSCCNPVHMEPVTSKLNTLRGNTVPGLNAAKDKCRRGHEFTAENTKTVPNPSGGNDWRSCRKCAVINSTNWQKLHGLR